MYQRQGSAAFKKDLTNIRLLLAECGNPERQLRVIHIGGTNGKGSVAHLIAAALQSTGQRVGLYTSPHYRDFRERIKINADLLSEEWVVDFIDAKREAISRISPSFFEITVAMAFTYFAEQRVDWAVIEVGLGGRLDSTNVVDPVLSIITNISFDHTQFLGDTLPQIASEKAGIIKPNCPVVIGETHPQTESIFRQKAIAAKAPITFADQIWQCTPTKETIYHTSFSVRFLGRDFLTDLAVNLHGPFQAVNLQTTLAALQELHSLGLFNCSLIHIKSAFTNLKEATYYIGRWQIIGDKPLTIIDSAHNEGGLRLVIDRLLEINQGQLHIVFGVVKDKELEKVLPLLPTAAHYYFVNANIPRALPADILAEKAALHGLIGHIYDTVKNGYRAARESAHRQDIVFVGG
ncbi:MAG: folylpolyglutamate synthase/dihydrofolate synthase family protein, partial [Bacteroidota bacterium]